MKKIKTIKFITIAISLFILSCATTVPKGYPFNEISGIFTYEDVVTIDGKNSDELYVAIKKWIALNYNSANNVIQLDDKENHTLIVKGNFQTSLFGKKGWYSHTINIVTRDNRFKYIITVSSYYSVGSGDMNFNSKAMGFKNTIFKDVDNNVKTTITRLTQFVSKQNSSTDEEW